MEKIERRGERFHTKASERYLDVIFHYSNTVSWVGSIPIEYRRTGTELTDPAEIAEYLLQCYDFCHPANWPDWIREQQEFWKTKPKAVETKAFFDALLSFEWRCVSCQMPANPNWARRIQDIKEMGYTLATDTTKFCSTCRSAKTHLLLVPIPRGGLTGYEAWSPALRKRIVSLLRGYDVYEGRAGRSEGLLPDHKFPEIRWDDKTRRETLENLTDEEIRRNFQLMSNQRNQQKREICRNCYQTGKRGSPFGVRYFYIGDASWPTAVPRRGDEAETGCLGCVWHDMAKWRESLNQSVGSPVELETTNEQGTLGLIYESGLETE